MLLVKSTLKKHPFRLFLPCFFGGGQRDIMKPGHKQTFASMGPTTGRSRFFYRKLERSAPVDIDGVCVVAFGRVYKVYMFNWYMISCNSMV